MLSAARDPCRALRAIGGAGPVLIAGAAAQVALGGFTPFLVSAHGFMRRTCSLFMSVVASGPVTWM